MLDLLHLLKDADFLAGFTEEFSSVAAFERIERDVLWRRLLLALFALVPDRSVLLGAVARFGPMSPRR
ncbi:hypothetical protein [Streptomyces canus]|uniref:hypothetical protein n=1 Tax=Streptomyces canus TaxID=58343 RepID=UPI0033B3C25C